MAFYEDGCNEPEIADIPDSIYNEDYGSIAGKDLIKKFTYTDWNAIEQHLSLFVKTVITVLKDFIASEDKKTDKKDKKDKKVKKDKIEKKETPKEMKYQVMGDFFYLKIRPLLEAALLVTKKNEDDEDGEDGEDDDDDDDDNEDKDKDKRRGQKQGTITKKSKGKKQQKKKGKTKDEIIMDSSLKKITEITNELLGTFTKKRFENNLSALHQKYVEMIGIYLMYHAFYMTKIQPEKYKKDKNHEAVLELNVGIHKYLEAAEKLEGKPIILESGKDGDHTVKVSKTLLKDLSKWIDSLNGLVMLDGKTLFDKAPRLLIYTKYDTLVPTIGIKPRKNQIDLVEKVKANIDRGFFISLKAMLSSGKTTAAVVCLSEIIRLLNENDESKEDRWQLLFVCNNNNVRLDAARIAWNGGIKFGNATLMSNDQSVTIINHNHTTNLDRVLIIAEPEAAQILLEKEIKDNKVYGKPGKIWLFLDEPTIGAENINSDSLKSNMSLLTKAPKHTILSSATMCELSMIPHIVENVVKRHPGILVDTVYSNEVQIGCDIKTLSNKYVIPYAGCKTGVELKSVIETISMNPFLGRTFTAHVAMMLWNHMTRENIEKIPDISEEFKHVKNLSLDNVRLICVEMLKLLSEQSDKIIEKICNDPSLFIVEKNEKKDQKKSDGDGIFTFEDEVIEVPDDVTPLLFGTHQAYKYIGMNLVITPDPITFAETNFKPLDDKIKEKINGSAKRMYDQYERELNEYQNKIDRLDKRIKREEDRTKQIQELDEHKPILKFPDEFQINTINHIKTFATGHFHEISDIESIRPINPLEKIPYKELRVEDWMIRLLDAGVGIVCPSKIKCPVYTSIVAGMAADNRFAYTIADKSIGYGTNNPYVREFIFNDTTSSINTLFQNLARVGRVGQSWKAEAYIDDEFAKMIYEYVKDPYTCPSALLEPQNMQQIFDQIVEENDLCDDERIKLFKQKQFDKEQKKKQDEPSKYFKELPKQDVDDCPHLVPLSEIKKRSSEYQEFPNNSRNSDSLNWRRRDDSQSDLKESKVSHHPIHSNTMHTSLVTERDIPNESKEKSMQRTLPTQPIQPVTNPSEVKKYIPPHLRNQRK